MSDASTPAAAAPEVAARADLRQDPRPQGERLTLRVLTGIHAGAEVPVRSERLLIGNLDCECDIVIDVGTSQRHLCLLRVGSDGWTVLGIAGDLWVGTEWVAAQQTRVFDRGTPLTLGRACLVIGSHADAGWADARPPASLVRPEPSGPVPVAVPAGTPPVSAGRWRAARALAGAGIGLLVSIGGFAYAASAMSVRAESGASRAQRFDNASNALKSLPFAAGLRLEPDARTPGWFVMSGFVPEADQVALAEKALGDLRPVTTLKVHAVGPLQEALAERLAGVGPAAVRHAGGGVFELALASAELGRVHAAIRAALDALGPVAEVRVTVSDVIGRDGEPAAVTYRRTVGARGAIAVDGAPWMDPPVGAHRIGQVRLGAMPSFVLEGAGRHFVGAMLPDGWRVERIDADTVTVGRGVWLRSLPVARGDGRESDATPSQTPSTQTDSRRAPPSVAARRGSQG